MGVKNFLANTKGKMSGAIAKAGNKAADKVAKLSVLSPEQLADLQAKREAYMSEKPDPNDPVAEELTRRLMASNSVEIYNAYLDQLKQLYQPIDKDAEYDTYFDQVHNIRYFNITKWVSDKKENSLEKLVNVYEVLSNEECNIALIFHRSIKKTEVYLAVTNTKNDDNNRNADDYIDRLKSAIKGNFPGAEWVNDDGAGVIPCMKNDYKYSVASVSNIPTEKSEKFVSQTIEKLLDGIIPSKKDQEYTIVLLATPVQDVEERKLKLAEFYTGLAPYASWQTDFTFTQSDSTNSMATFGVNAGVSAGIQQGQNSAVTNSNGTTDSTSKTDTESTNDTVTDSTSETDTTNKSTTQTDSSGKTLTDSTSQATANGTSQANSTNTTNTTSQNSSTTESDAFSVNGGASFIANAGVSNTTTNGTTTGSGTSQSLAEGVTDTISQTITNSTSNSVANTVTQALASTVGSSLAKTTGKAVASSVGKSIAQTVGKAVTNTVATTAGIYKGINLGGNFGANFARSSNVTATVGKNEGIHQTFTNYTIKHTLELLEEQMKRYEMSTALGMWDFAAYIISEDSNVANNVAHSYLALTQGETSHMSCAAVNLWRGDLGEKSNDAKEIYSYIKELRHPLFGLNPEITDYDPKFNVYPAVVTATTSLSGKELAYSLNFPQKSIAGLPVIECAEFGRNVVSYDFSDVKDRKVHLGNIFHMNHQENNSVELSVDALASHTFITGSTGSGKSNTVYQILNEVGELGIKFLIIEPAKGEYKDIYGNDPDVDVYSTNKLVAPLLRINPFSFPEGVHVFEHIERLVEIFNVCWPMYAAMPAVLKNAVQKSYEDCGWDVISSTNAYGNNLYPCFADVARNVRNIIDSSEYDSENKGAYKGSLLTRLESLTNGINGLVFVDDELSYEELFNRNVIVDLSRVGSNETKSLLMGMLVLKLQEYRLVSDGGMNEPLKHITVLEEAHNLLKRTSQDMSSESGNLIGKSVEMISNAIAEMRTYGEGFIIADQAPGLLDMAAIRNTNTKIIMRLPDQGDRELVGRAASLDDDQIIELAKLPRGVAAVYQNEWVLPVLCKVDKSDYCAGKYINIGDKKSDKVISPEISLRIMELLSQGISLDKEMIFKEIVPDIDSLSIISSAKVAIIKMIMNPPAAPRMTKLAPIVNELFPSVVKAIKDTYSYNSNTASDWTQSAYQALIELGNFTIKEQVRRDIIQGAMTYYFLNEVKNEKALQDWSINGGLR